MGKKSNMGKKGENDIQHPTSNIQQDEYLQGWKRALADYENLKRDLDKIKEENRNHIRIDLAQQLLPIMDNFEQAVNHVPDLSAVDRSVRKTSKLGYRGVTFIKQQFETTMSELGIEKIEVKGEFDPNLHEIAEEGEELKELSAGWKIGERVLRPAKIIINKEGIDKRGNR